MKRRLSARSIVASTLLGTHPPVLPSRLLVAFAAEFDVSEGATRVALSRMVDRGELLATDGSYELCGPLLARQIRQAAGLAPDVAPWDGTWEMYVVRPGARSTADRSGLRRALGHLGLAERREGTWLRPANLAENRLPDTAAVVADQADRFIARPDGSARALTAAIFPLAEWAGRALALREAMAELVDALDGGDRSVLAPGFELAAAVLRHLVADPRLPDELVPADWPAAALRDHYRDYDRRYRAVLRDFFADIG